jgi:hypothetical protein
LDGFPFTGLINDEWGRKLLFVLVVVPPSSRVDKMVLPQSIELPGITQFDNNGQAWVSDHCGRVAKMKVRAIGSKRKVKHDG